METGAWNCGCVDAYACFYDDFILATNLAIETGLLPCKHFPQMSLPKVLAEHMVKCVEDGA